VHPASGRLAPAREVVDALVQHVGSALDAAGDRDLVADVLPRCVSDNGATRQRAAFERTGELVSVVDDLIARTEASWRTPARS